MKELNKKTFVSILVAILTFIIFSAIGYYFMSKYVSKVEAEARCEYCFDLLANDEVFVAKYGQIDSFFVEFGNSSQVVDCIDEDKIYQVKCIAKSSDNNEHTLYFFYKYSSKIDSSVLTLELLGYSESPYRNLTS